MLLELFKSSLGILLGCLTLIVSANELKHNNNIVATVNGNQVSQAMLDFLVETRAQGHLAASPNSEKILNDLVTTEILYQAALEAKTKDRARNRIELELAHKTLVSQLYVMDYLTTLNIDDQTLRTAYDGISSPVMVQMSHWDFKNKAAAENFLDSVINKQEAPSTQGITEPWQDLNNFPFGDSQQAAELASGDWLSMPIENNTTWQVWRCLERSEITKPPFEIAREGIRQELGQEKLNAHIEALKDNATIILNLE